MTAASASITLQHSAGPIRWMPTGSAHRAIIDRSVIVADTGKTITVDGGISSKYLDVSHQTMPFDDPVIEALSQRFFALRSLTEGGLWEGLVTSITAQAISLHSAAAFQRRLSMLLSTPVESHGRIFWSLPSPEQVADLTTEQLREVGLTTKRSDGLIAVAREVANGNVLAPDDDDIDYWMKNLNKLPMVGPWTSASTLLWGLGHPDSFPVGDVALLRAARLAYDDAAMTMADLVRISEGWRPQRAIASRLLWTGLLGTAWDD